MSERLGMEKLPSFSSGPAVRTVLSADVNQAMDTISFSWENRLQSRIGLRLRSAHKEHLQENAMVIERERCLYQKDGCGCQRARRVLQRDLYGAP